MVSAKCNTWSHSRRRRRQQQRLQQQPAATPGITSGSITASDGLGTDGKINSSAKHIRLDKTARLSAERSPHQTADSATASRVSQVSTDSAVLASSEDEEGEPLITFSLELRAEGTETKLHVKLVEGKAEKKDMLHQILQYIKNRLH